MKRATVYFEEDLHKALKLKSIESESSISEIVNMAVRDTLDEDLGDLLEIKKRQSEGVISYESFLKQLKSRGQI
ncbi:MAG: CopG family transcriptional regulator [Verrucomicrobiota bacterium]